MLTALVSFVGFTATVAGISYWITRNDRMDSSDAYFLGGRNLTGWVIAGSLMLTNLSAEQSSCQASSPTTCSKTA